MSDFLMTCDREGDLIRAAVWRGRELCDLYMDSIANPDLTGALVCGKAVRVAAKNKAAWFETAGGGNVFVEDVQDIRAGDVKTLLVRTTCSSGKASRGVVVGESPAGASGIVQSPPAPWQRALEDINDRKILCRFAEREDWLACEAYAANRKGVSLSPLAKGNVHPELDEWIESLLRRRVFLKGGGEIVIDSVEALVAIDVNAGEASNPTAVNLAAMQQVAREIRLRNLSGIIVVDALRMKARTDKAKILGALKRACENDPLHPDIWGMTKVGLVEITRARRGPSLNELVGR